MGSMLDRAKNLLGFAQYFSDRREGLPVMRRYAEPRQGRLVFGSAVTHVGGPAVSGKFRCQANHHPVAGDFGHDRCRRNRQRQTIAFHHGRDAAGQGRPAIAVHQTMIDGQGQRRDGALHGEIGGPKNIAAVNLRDIGGAPSEGDGGGGFEFSEQPLPARRGQLLGIVEAVAQRCRQSAGVKHRRTCNHRPRPRTAPGLIDAGDDRRRPRRQDLMFQSEVGHREAQFFVRATMGGPDKPGNRGV